MGMASGSFSVDLAPGLSLMSRTAVQQLECTGTSDSARVSHTNAIAKPFPIVLDWTAEMAATYEFEFIILLDGFDDWWIHTSGHEIVVGDKDVDGDGDGGEDDTDDYV